MSTPILLLQRLFIAMESNSTKLRALISQIGDVKSRLIPIRDEIIQIQQAVFELTGGNKLLNEVDSLSNILDTSESQLLSYKRSNSTLETPNKRIKVLSNNVESSLSFSKSGEYVVVYTDGACENNGKSNAKAGIGVWWGHNHPLNVSEPAKLRQTNNAAEIQACTKACEVASENGISKLLIKTDSQFVINCITMWMPKWIKNHWMTASNKPVINKEDLVDLINAKKKLIDVKFEHIRGHCGIEGNEEADRLAVQGANKM